MPPKSKTAPKTPVKAKSQKTVEEPKHVEQKKVEPPAPVEPAPVEAPVEEPKSTENYAELMKMLIEIDKLVKSTMPMVKKLQKQHEKDVKAAEKSKKVKRRRDPNAPPSGFARPGKVSTELTKFLGLGADEEIARTKVAQQISQYIKDHDLKNKDNKKEIILDDKLSSLFNLKKGDKVEYFKIQTYLSPHFVKSRPVSA